ncbi:MAG: hypothetical protein ACRCXT_16330 [Paraclostridium sp.]
MEQRIDGLKSMIKKYFKGELVIENYKAGNYSFDLFIMGMGVGIVFDGSDVDKVHNLRDVMGKCNVNDILEIEMSNECPLELYKDGYDSDHTYIVDFNKTDVDIFVELISMRDNYNNIEYQIRHNDDGFINRSINSIKDVHIDNSYTYGMDGFKMEEIEESFIFYINNRKQNLFKSHYLMSENFWIKELDRYGIDRKYKLEEIRQ